MRDSTHTHTLSIFNLLRSTCPKSRLHAHLKYISLDSPSPYSCFVLFSLNERRGSATSSKLLYAQAYAGLHHRPHKDAKQSHHLSSTPSTAHSSLRTMPSFSYHRVVFHDGIMQLVAFAGSSRQETCLADVHIELLEAAVSGATGKLFTVTHQPSCWMNFCVSFHT